MDPGSGQSSWSRPLFNLNSRAWLQLRVKYPQRIDWRLQTRIRIVSVLASAVGRMQEILHGERLAAVAIKAPTFVIGHWRSGTTLLHEMMALDERLLAPNTYQCFNPHSFLLSSNGSGHRVSMVRPSGDRVVSSESPQEEEFAMLCLGCVSPYEGFIFPSALRRLSSLCDPDTFDETQRTEWERRFVDFLKGVCLGGGQHKTLLLKSPSNSFRIATLLRLFPDAKFIWIVREPTAVIVSALDMWEKMWERYALGAPLRRSTVQDLVIDSYLALERKLSVDTQTLASSKLVSIKFEDLVARPNETFELIYSTLQLGDWSQLRTPINRFLESSPPLRSPHRATPAQIDEVRERCGAAFDKHGYQRP